MKRRTDQYASFKDPAAQVFTVEEDDAFIYRQLNPEYLPHYKHFISSGLSDELVRKNWLIPFEEFSEEGVTILKARKIKFVAYPYEWTFNQWKDAALLTLKIHFQALKYGMILKDANPFNIVFDGYKPLFIDLSSFEMHTGGQPWGAFKQFSENFYLPVLLVKYFDAIGNDIYLNNINGIPLRKGLPLLPLKAFFNLNTLFFLALPGKLREQLKEKDRKTTSKTFTGKRSMHFAEQMFSIINKIRQPKRKTKWNDYYNKDIDTAYLLEKTEVLVSWTGTRYKYKTVLDFGCNTGNFSKMLSTVVESIIAFDDDIRSVDELYNYCKTEKITNITCLTADISSPTPAMGWNNLERPAFIKRLSGDVGLVLALVHHLAISNHIRFEMMADLFAASCTELFIEFIPKDDPKALLLTGDRAHIFSWYNYENFQQAFNKNFTLIKEHRFTNNRILVHFIRTKDVH